MMIPCGEYYGDMENNYATIGNQMESARCRAH